MSSSATGVGMPICFLGAILLILTQKSSQKFGDVLGIMITIDEKSNKERKTKVRYLVQGDTIEKARKNVDEIMGKTMIDYNITSLKETSIMDVFLHMGKPKE